MNEDNGFKNKNDKPESPLEPAVQTEITPESAVQPEKSSPAESVVEPAPSVETADAEPASESPEPTDSPSEQADSAETTADSPQEETLQQVTTSGGPGKSKLGKILLILLILALIAGLCYTGWKLSSQKPATVSTQAQTAKKPVSLVRIGVIEGELNSFYPSTEDTSSASYQLNTQVYEGLVKYTDVSKITPSLATSWTNPDDTTWIFNLKPGVKFHNGNRMKAADVKSSLEKYNQDAYHGVFNIDLKEVTVVSDNKVKIVTASPDPLLLNKLTFLAVVDSNSKPSDPSGATGPYQVKSGTTPSATDLDLVAFNQYHGGTPLTREIQWKYYSSEDELVKATLDGKVDYTTAIDIVKNKDLVKQKTNLAVLTDTGIGVTSLGINLNKAGSPLKNPKFRQAIALALDKQQIITDSNLVAEPAEQAVTEDIPGYNSAIPKTKPDLEAAKKALTDAGYAKGASFSIVYDKGAAQDQIDSITKQLKQINVTVKQVPYTDFNALVDDAFNGSADSYFLSYSTDLFDSSDVLAANFQQTPNYSNAKFDALLDSASTTIDPTKRLADLKEASKIAVVDDIGEIPLYSMSYNVSYRSDLNIVRDTYITTYFWQVYKKG